MSDFFSSYEINIDEEVCNRITSQFKQSTQVFQPTIASISIQIQDLVDINIEVLESHITDCATGELLDNIGEIIGLKRGVEESGLALWYTVDDNTYTVDTIDVGAWITGAPLYNVVSIDDVTYRQRLHGQAFKNHAVNGLGDFYAWVRISYGVDISLIRDNVSFRDFALVYNSGTVTQEIIDEIIDYQNTNRVNGEYFSPVPPGFRLTSTVPIINPVYGVDRNDDFIGAADLGYATIFSPVL